MHFLSEMYTIIGYTERSAYDLNLHYKGPFLRALVLALAMMLGLTFLCAAEASEDSASCVVTDYREAVALTRGDSRGRSAAGEAAQSSAEKRAKYVIIAADWWESDIQTVFPRGGTATVTDVDSGISWQVSRYQGTNHADCQPLTSEDAAKMKQACGGEWTWERRAIIVTIDGKHYAASMNCMPHGNGSIGGNGFGGHHCIHFINSRTSGTNKVCPYHQDAIKKALSLNSMM